MITREPVYTDAPANVLDGVRRAAVLVMGNIGRAGSMTLQSLVMIPVLFASRRSRNELIRQMFIAGIKSLALITIVFVFTLLSRGHSALFARKHRV